MNQSKKIIETNDSNDTEAERSREIWRKLSQAPKVVNISICLLLVKLSKIAKNAHGFERETQAHSLPERATRSRLEKGSTAPTSHNNKSQKEMTKRCRWFIHQQKALFFSQKLNFQGGKTFRWTLTLWSPKRKATKTIGPDWPLGNKGLCFVTRFVLWTLGKRRLWQKEWITGTRGRLLSQRTDLVDASQTMTSRKSRLVVKFYSSLTGPTIE